MTTMKGLMICFACFLMILALTPSLHAAQPAPAVQADLAAQIFAPATSAAASPADPAQATSADLFLPVPQKVLACTTYAQCVSGCSDCPWGTHSYCISMTTCRCGCKH
jgi:hypothetical protein